MMTNAKFKICDSKYMDTWPNTLAFVWLLKKLRDDYTISTIRVKMAK